MVKVFIVERESKEKKKQAGHGQGYLRENGEEQSRGDHRGQQESKRHDRQRLGFQGGPAGKLGKSTNWRHIRVAQKVRGLGCDQDFEMYNKYL